MTYIQSLSVNIAETLQNASGMTSEQLQSLLAVSDRNLNAAKIIVAIVPLLVIYPFYRNILYRNCCWGCKRIILIMR